MAELQPLIVLIATVRSGTTMTAACFKHHADVAILREQRMLWTIGNTHLKHDRFTEAQANPKVIRKIRQAFLEFQEEKGGRRIFEKTPSNCLRVPFIHAIFPDAVMVNLVRNGRDNVSSCLPFWTRPRKQRRIVRRIKETPISQWPGLIPRFVRDQVGVRLGLTRRVRSWGVVYPGMFDDLGTMQLVEVIAKQWRYAVETSRADLDAIGRANYIEWKYEELCAKPHAHFQQVLGRAGLEMTEELDRYLTESVHNEAVNAWKKRLTVGQVRLIDPIIKPAMDMLGYEMPAVDDSFPDDLTVTEAEAQRKQGGAPRSGPSGPIEEPSHVA
jgi:hypothetical protein